MACNIIFAGETCLPLGRTGSMGLDEQMQRLKKGEAFIQVLYRQMTGRSKLDEVFLEFLEGKGTERD